jgi:hypothetical protein
MILFYSFFYSIINAKIFVCFFIIVLVNKLSNSILIFEWYVTVISMDHVAIMQIKVNFNSFILASYTIIYKLVK